MPKTYNETLNDYYTIILRKFERGLISESKFDRLASKIIEWGDTAQTLRK